MSGLILNGCSLPHFNLVKLLKISLHVTLVSGKTVMKQKEEHQPPEKKLRAVCKSSDTARKDGNENQIYLKFTSSTDTA